ncbi:MAG: substrate-binding domain-containing protein [Victivallales bacterium]|jgi:LacI family transcriptional regulator|nr:substrate-binding domain-containing protein [Victivallales bacterium]
MQRNFTSQVQLVVEHLRRILAVTPKGRRLPPYRKLQQICNTNQRVIFAALNLLKSQGDVEVIPQMGFFSTGTLCRTNTAIIQLSFPEYPSPLLLALMEQCDEYAKKTNGIQFRKRRYNYEQETLFSDNADCDGCVFVAPSREFTREELQYLVSFPKPLLALFKHLDEIPISSIAVNDSLRGTLAADYLLKHGHRKLGLVICEPNLYGITKQQEAFETMARCNAVECVKIDCSVASGNYPPQIAYETMMNYLSEQKDTFSALFVIDSFAIPGILTALRENNLRVPEDVSLIGSGDLPGNNFLSPPLTSVGAKVEEMAEVIVDTVQKMVKNPEKTFHIELPPRLHERQSVSMVSSRMKATSKNPIFRGSL